MTCFDRHALEHLKKLCRIDLEPEEEADLLNSLKRILEYIEQLDEVNTEGVQPCSYVLRGMIENTWREDVPSVGLSREQFLDNAPDQIAGMVKVPPILKTL